MARAREEGVEMGGAGEGEGKVGKGKAVQKGWREEWEGRAGKGEA